MTPDLQTMLLAAAATIAGNIVAALVIWRLIDWRRTRDWRNLLAPLFLTVWVCLAAYLSLAGKPGVDRTFSVMIAGGIIGGLLSARAIFGIVRYSKAETALGDDPQYKGSFGDVFAFLIALAPVLAAAFLF